MKKANSWLQNQAPLGVKGPESFDWVNHDQINNVVLEEWPSMMHNTVLDGDGSCERSHFNEGGLGFASSQIRKGRGWQHEKVVDVITFSRVYCLFRHISFSLPFSTRISCLGIPSLSLRGLLEESFISCPLSG